MSGKTLAIVVKGFPRLSETFVARELAALEARDIRFTLHALRAPGSDAKLTDAKVSARPDYLPEYLHRAPLTVAGALISALGRRGFGAAFRCFLRDLGRDFSIARVRRFGQACVLAQRLGPEVKHIHAHFAHSPASVARYAARIRGTGFSFSAHAKDIWTTPELDLAAKLEEARFAVVCNRAGHDRLASLGTGNRPELLHHGIAAGLVVAQPPPQERDGSRAEVPVRLVSVARAVEKKGLKFLLQALAQVPAELQFRLDHYGGGGLLPELKSMTQQLGLSSRVQWHGAVAHEQVVRALDQSDLFVLGAVVSRDGDRDGIANAVLEAQARGVCVVASAAGGISEAVTDKVSGRLVQPGNTRQLAETIAELIASPQQRFQLATNALRRDDRLFDAEKGYDRLALLLTKCLVD